MLASECPLSVPATTPGPRFVGGHHLAIGHEIRPRSLRSHTCNGDGSSLSVDSEVSPLSVCDLGGLTWLARTFLVDLGQEALRAGGAGCRSKPYVTPYGNPRRTRGPR